MVIQPKVSVGVTFYNNEAYVRQCLESLVHQTLQDIEIVVVNDCSPDNGLAIIQEYAARDARIKVIDLPQNGGFAHAINTTIKHATGEYWIQCDSDDYVAPDMYEILYNRAKENDLDYVCCCAYNFMGSGEDVVQKPYQFGTLDLYDRVCTDEDFKNDPIKYGTWFSLWSSMFKRDFLNDHAIRMHENVRSCTDNAFFLLTRVYAKRAMFLQDKLYFRRFDNTNSMVHKIDSLANDMRMDSELLRERLIEEGIFEENALFYMHRKYMNLLNFILNNTPIEHLRETLVEIRAQAVADHVYVTDPRFFYRHELRLLLRDIDQFYRNYMDNRYALSVVLPVYDDAENLAASLERLTHQAIHSAEFLLVNYANDARITALLARFASFDMRFRIVDPQEAAELQDVVAASAYGKYLAEFSALDLSTETALVELLRTARAEKYGENTSGLRINPARMLQIQAVYAADENVAFALSASIISMLENAKKETFYDITVLVPEVFQHATRAKIVSIQEGYTNVRIRFLEVSDEHFGEILINTEHLSKVCFYRLLIPNMLPDAERCIYLDCDTLVLQDLSALYNTPFNDNLLAGVKTASYFYPKEWQESKREELGIEIDTYINSGLLLMNLAAMREVSLPQKCIALAKMNFRSEDQDVLNVACHGRILNIPLKFNAMTKLASPLGIEKWKAEKVYAKVELDEAIEAPVIQHFTNAVKPWTNFELWNADLWFSYAIKSPLFNADDYPLYPVYQVFRELTAFEESTDFSVPHPLPDNHRDLSESYKLSIIMPNFNMAETVCESLRSVLTNAAFLGNVELLIVDDGSEDNSLNIVCAYAERFPFIKVYAQTNQGSGKARNLALSKARGEFVAFMDSDDYYPTYDTLAKLYTTAKEKDVLVCGGSFANLRANGFLFTDYVFPLHGYKFDESGYVDFADYQFDFSYQRFIFQRQMLLEHQIDFPDYLRYQDVPFFVNAMIAAERFYALKDVTYVYRWGHKTINWTERKTIDLLRGISSVLQIAHQHGHRDLYHLTFLRYRDYLRKGVFLEALTQNERPHQILAALLRFTHRLDREILAEYDIAPDEISIKALIDSLYPYMDVGVLLKELQGGQSHV
ncbi:MAG: glycosyltransferase [Oscillospiraceae bacterium]|jgi:glycosyltransferase involved in cell wall biosynthesis/lipopolysaccharide biosynthesis glycosyltransferase|nr:glycosyltransferase [Oscillospiraceae bacterium]